MAATAAALAVAVAAGVWALTLASSEDEPMREEDVVRLLVRGVSEDEVIRAIRSRPPGFSLSTEMRDELRRAGVTQTVIDAMLERVAEDDPSPPDVPPGVTTSARGPVLAVAFEREDDGGPPRVAVESVVDFRIREAWQLDAALEGEPFEDLALYLACRTATHVPDHWRSKSPLGRDFISMPRHRMLAFVSGAEREGRAGRRLVLELPAALEAEMDEPGLHDLSLGFALRAGGRYYRLTDDLRDGVALEGERTELAAGVRGDGRDPGRLEVRFVTAAAQAASGGGADGSVEGQRDDP